MDPKLFLYCRGCLSELTPDSSYSLMSQKTKDLFTNCTAIKVLPNEYEGLPRQICSDCFTKCEDWAAFREICHTVDAKLQKYIPELATAPIEQPPPINMEIKEEVMELDTSLPMPFLMCETVYEGQNQQNEGQIEPVEAQNEPVEGQIEPVEGQNEPDEGYYQEDTSTNEDTLTNETSDQCPVCQVILPVSLNLETHLKQHFSAEDPQCPICDEQFSLASDVYPHVVDMHMGNGVAHPPEDIPDTMKTCPICSTQTEKLWTHLSSFHSTRGQPDCPICQKPFVNVTSHIIVMHTTERPFACGYCPMSFRQNYLRQHHWRTQHKRGAEPVTMQEPKRYGAECPVCHKSFQRSALLHEHFVCHTDEEPYSCNYCDLKSKWKNNVYAHIRRLHPEESAVEGVTLKEGSIMWHPRPWETMGYFNVECDRELVGKAREKKGAGPKLICPQCPRVFSSESLLRRHAPAHNKKRPFLCAHCQKVFSHSAKLKAHKEKQHPVEYQEEVEKEGSKSDEKRVGMRKEKSHSSSVDKKVEVEESRKDLTVEMGPEVGSPQRLLRKSGMPRIERPFKCQHCEKGFLNKRNLKAHEKKHGVEEESPKKTTVLKKANKEAEEQTKMLRNKKKALRSGDRKVEGEENKDPMTGETESKVDKVPGAGKAQGRSKRVLRNQPQIELKDCSVIVDMPDFY